MGVTRGDVAVFAAVVGAILYPWFLNAFHWLVGPPAIHVSTTSLAYMGGALVLALVFAIPFGGFLAAYGCSTLRVSMRRLAYGVVAAPTLYVFLGVLNYMAKTAYSDETLWTAMWVGFAAWAWFVPSTAPGAGTVVPREMEVKRARITHGLVALLIIAYLAFHFINHLYYWDGVVSADAVRKAGEVVYRAPRLEVLLVAAFIVQCFIGAYLAWRWTASETRRDFFRTFQIASGVFLLIYIVGHMDSVFIYQRLFNRGTTDWSFATGGPSGIIHNAWNIRLLPHYALGVFFASTHPLTGLRNILVHHGTEVKAANRIWIGGTAAAVILVAATMAGMALLTVGMTP